MFSTPKVLTSTFECVSCSILLGRKWKRHRTFRQGNNLSMMRSGEPCGQRLIGGGQVNTIKTGEIPYHIGATPMIASLNCIAGEYALLSSGLPFLGMSRLFSRSGIINHRTNNRQTKPCKLNDVRVEPRGKQSSLGSAWAATPYAGAVSFHRTHIGGRL